MYPDSHFLVSLLEETVRDGLGRMETHVGHNFLGCESHSLRHRCNVQWAAKRGKDQTDQCVTNVKVDSGGEIIRWRQRVTCRGN